MIDNVIGLVENPSFNLPAYIPWWNKFKGIVSMDEHDPSKFNIRGNYTYSDGRVHITELPVGVWTAPYKEYLEELQKSGRIIDFQCMVDDTSVDIVINVNNGPVELSNLDAQIQSFEFEMGTREGIANEKKRKATELTAVNSTEELEKMLKLTSSVRVSNVHLYTTPYPMGERSYIKKYNDINSIYHEFIAVRRIGYERRKAHELGVLNKSMKISSYHMKFIEAKLDGQLILENRDEADICTDLAQMGFPLGSELGIKK